MRVHSGPQASAIGALAFTHGSNLYFAPGLYNPGSLDGRRLLGHELAHVVQQRAGRVRNPFGSDLALVQDDALEADARRMGEQAAAIRSAGFSSQPLQRSTAPGTGMLRAGSIQRLAPPAPLPRQYAVIQALFEGLATFVSDTYHNKRKVGVEITEATTGGNRILELTATPAWTGLGAGQAAMWTHTVNLPDRTGAVHVWHAADPATMAAYFVPTNGAKGKWMKWVEVVMTEDYGEFEWIIEHPAAPQPVSEYRRRLNNVNTSRVAMRAAIGALPYNPVVLSMTIAGLAHEVFLIDLQGGVNGVSSQITMEITERLTALRAFQEGLTPGNPTLYSARPDYQNLLQDLNAGATLANLPARVADLNSLLNAYTGNFLITAYNETVDALTDSTFAAHDVVRSGGFAVHAANQKAFAFEDRGEVQDSFPALNATYDRIVSLVDRY